MRHRLPRRPRRSPRDATGRRRPPRARSTAPSRRARRSRRVGHAVAQRAVTDDHAGQPSVASRNRGSPSPPRGGPTKRTCGGSSGSPTLAGIATPLGTTRTSRAPSARASPRERRRGADDEARTPDERRTSPGARRASSTSVPQSCRRTASRSRAPEAPTEASGRGPGRRPRAARRAATREREEEQRHEQRLPRRSPRLPTIPSP